MQRWGGWSVVVGLMAVQTWTTLCLGGWLADTMAWTAPAVLGLAALGGLLLGIGGSGVPRLHAAVLWPLPFLVYATASALWLAPAPWLAWREVWLWWQTWIVFGLALHFLRTPAQAWCLAGIHLALGLAGVLMAAHQRYVDPGWLMLGREQADQFLNRSAGMFGIPNSLAGLLELLLPACLVVAVARRSGLVARVGAGWLAVCFVFALILTGSRGGWLALIAVLAGWPLLAAGHWRRKLIGSAAILACLALGLVALYQFSAPARARMLPFLNGEIEASRPLVWRAGLDLWRDAPLLGTGAGSFNTLFDRHRPAGFLNEPEWTHNDYLNTLSDYGVMGFLLWLGAGAGLMTWGWRLVQQARTERGPGGFLGGWRVRFGLWLGLAAYGLHLLVDFHTKIPALAFAAACALALLLRSPQVPVPSASPWPLRGLAAVWLVLALAFLLSDQVGAYRAEALRYEARRRINHLAKGTGNRDLVVPAAIIKLQEAVKLDPRNGQAWGDLAYATTLSWHVTRAASGPIGQRAERHAAEAVTRCSFVAGFFIWQGIALDMQSKPTEAESSFRRAIALAPHNPETHYNYAYHLARLPGRTDEALAAVETCLSLDRGNSQAVALRERLSTNR